jgi:hypothetical protein
MPYNVHFEARSSVRTVKAEEIKFGNQYLQCKADTQNNDSATVAYIPFDSVLYIAHDSAAVSTQSD